MRRRAIVLLFLAAGLIAVVASDHLLFRLPGSLTRHFERRIGRQYQKSGLLALWTFDEPSVRDRVSGAAATAFGTELTGGRYGQARLFHGTENDYIVTGVPWRALGDQYTISVWVKLNRASPTQSIVVGRRRSPTGLLLADGHILLWVPHDHTQVASYRFEKYDEFVNITGVVDARSGQAWLYENGSLKATIPVAGLEHIPAHIEFGKYQDLRVYFPLNGALDETAIWTRALSPAEVRDVAWSRGSLTYAGIAFRHVAALYALDGIAAAADAVLKTLDYFNPLYHEARIYESGLPAVNLRLSRKDRLYFRRAQRERLATGHAGEATSKRRKVELIVENEPHEAEMALYGQDPASWDNPKLTFTIKADALTSVLGARRMAFFPPETTGLLRPLVHRRLAARYRLPHDVGGLTIVRINGEFAGLYHVREQPVDGLPAAGGDLPGVFTSLPVPGAELLKEYDAVRQEVEPLLVRDRTISWNSRRIRYAIRKDRDTLAQIAAGSPTRSEREDVELLHTYLTPRRLLNGNPAPTHVLDDLALDVVSIPSVRLTWTSSHPEVVDHRGRVRRPESGPVPVTLEASIARGSIVEKKALSFTVMPRRLTLPVLRLEVPGEVLNSHRTPCLVELIEEASAKRTGTRPCAIKLRGNTSLRHPKRSYSLRLEEAPRFFDASDARIVHLIALHSDSSLMRNKLAYDIFRSFGGPTLSRYSPRARLVEVAINGEYRGVYQLSERVDRFLLGFDPYRASESLHSVIYKAQDGSADFDRFAKAAYVQVEPGLERGEYWAPLEDLTRFVAGADREAFRRDIQRWIDVAAYIDFHILVNLFNNREGIRYNLFLARGNDGPRPFVIVPWDYDKSIFRGTDRWLTNALFERLWRDVPEFRVQFKNRWSELRTRQLSERTLMARIDEIEASIADGVKREFARWPREVTHEASVRQVKTWLRERLLFLDRLVGGW